MDMQEIFSKYRRRLVHIAIFRSAVSGLALALLAVGAAALLLWAARASVPVIIGVTAGAGAATLLLSVPLLYFKRLRPTERQLVAELDALGLEERTVTMYECQDDGSPMAGMQREDAKLRVTALPKRLLKFTVALPVVLLLLSGTLFAAGATTASVIAAGNTEPPAETVPPIAEETVTFTVTYRVYEEGTGSIAGEAVQKIERGGSTAPVTAIPAEGFRFAAWVDADKKPLANQNPTRNEINVRADMTVCAYFEKIALPSDGGESDGDNGDGEEEDGNRDHEQEDAPPTEEPETPGTGEQGGEGNNEDGSDGRMDNNVIDGTQDYRENFDREAKEKELSGKDIPDDLKDILGDYYDTLKP